MKVWIVMEVDYDYTGILGVYTDEAKADARKKELDEAQLSKPKWNRDYHTIEEHEIIH